MSPSPENPDHVPDLEKLVQEELRENVLRKLRQGRRNDNPDNDNPNDDNGGSAGDREPRNPKIPPAAGAMALELADN